MKSSRFGIEIYGNEIFDGFTNGENWNGWACPYFTFDESRRIAEVHRKTGQNAGYDENTDTFYFEVQDEDEFFPAIELEGKKVYPIGNSSWIWEEKYR